MIDSTPYPQKLPTDAGSFQNGRLQISGKTNGKRCCLKMILKNHKRQHLFLLLCSNEAVEKTPQNSKNSALILRGISASQKSVLFLLCFCYAALGTIRCVPNRPLCILWCNFRMLYAMLTRCHSTFTFFLPRIINRRKFISSLIMANTPSA